MFVICVLGLLTFLYHTIADFLWVENLTWYLDSIASLMQSLITVICLLCFTCRLFYYIGARVSKEDHNISIWRTFTPIFVLAAFIMFKIVLCKVRRPFYIFLLAACLVATAYFFESHLDKET